MYCADKSEINPSAIYISIKPYAVVVYLQQSLVMRHLEWLGNCAANCHANCKEDTVPTQSGLKSGRNGLPQPN